MQIPFATKVAPERIRLLPETVGVPHTLPAEPEDTPAIGDPGVSPAGIGSEKPHCVKLDSELPVTTICSVDVPPTGIPAGENDFTTVGGGKAAKTPSVLPPPPTHGENSQPPKLAL